MMNRQRFLNLLLSLSLILSPLTGCEKSSNSNDEKQILTLNEKISSPADSVWVTAATTTQNGLTIVSRAVSSSTAAVKDASQAIWLWSTAQGADGWEWIRENAGEATVWAGDTVGDAWAVTESAAGNMSLWVQVETETGIGWARTALPSAWEIVKDEANVAWVWINEHKIEVAMVAAVAAIVIAALILTPETAGPAIVKGAAVGGGKETLTFLQEAWKEQSPDARSRLRGVSEATFLSIGQAVLIQCGQEVLAGA